MRSNSGKEYGLGITVPRCEAIRYVLLRRYVRYDITNMPLLPVACAACLPRWELRQGTSATLHTRCNATQDNISAFVACAACLPVRISTQTGLPRWELRQGTSATLHTRCNATQDNISAFVACVACLPVRISTQTGLPRWELRQGRKRNVAYKMQRYTR